LLDDGAWRYALAADALVAFLGKWQKPVIDVSPTGGGFDVRITGLVGRQRPVEAADEYFILDPPARADERAGWEKDQPLPPFRCGVSLLEAAFHNTTFAIDDGFCHQNPIPIPVVFARVGKGKPQPRVRFVATG
jgi:hypothetical protein